MGRSGVAGGGQDSAGINPGESVREPELSIVIASYNARWSIATCLDSLRLQKTSRTFETILVDSSTDGTGDLVRQRYPEVKLITSTSPPFSRRWARNLGIIVAQAKIIAFLDADCFVEPSWVDAILESHRTPHLLGLRSRPERHP